MIWLNFSAFATTVLCLWVPAFVLLLWNPAPPIFRRTATVLAALGGLVIASFLACLWIEIQRPPMRTLGETRLWYTTFLPWVGLLTYRRWRYAWFLAFCLAMASLFLLINVWHPEAHHKAMMPALRSLWFVPHVVVYILAYALLAASALVAAKGLFDFYIRKTEVVSLALADNIVYIGFAFLTSGLLFGALWAKEAWGHYWAWDPKETWAFITWLSYLAYIHLRLIDTQSKLRPLWMLSVAFVLLIFGWFGIQYLPAAQHSVHTYGLSQ